MAVIKLHILKKRQPTLSGNVLEKNKTLQYQSVCQQSRQTGWLVVVLSGVSAAQPSDAEFWYILATSRIDLNLEMAGYPGLIMKNKTLSYSSYTINSSVTVQIICIHNKFQFYKILYILKNKQKKDVQKEWIKKIHVFNLPMPKFLGLFSKSGLTTFFGSAFFTAKGAAATFLPTFFLGYKINFCIRYISFKKSKSKIITNNSKSEILVVIVLLSSKTCETENTHHTHSQYISLPHLGLAWKLATLNDVFHGFPQFPQTNVRIAS